MQPEELVNKKGADSNEKDKSDFGYSSSHLSY